MHEYLKKVKGAAGGECALRQAVEHEGYVYDDMFMDEVFPDCVEVDDDLLISVAGMKFKFISGERENEYMYYIFQLNDKTFRAVGSYDSWNGCELHDVLDAHEVVLKTITKEIWVAV